MSGAQSFGNGPRHDGTNASSAPNPEQMRRQLSASSTKSNGDSNGSAQRNQQSGAHYSTHPTNPYQNYQSPPVNPYMNPYGSSGSNMAMQQVHSSGSVQHHRRPSGPSPAANVYSYPPQGHFYPPTFPPGQQPNHSMPQQPARASQQGQQGQYVMSYHQQQQQQAQMQQHYQPQMQFHQYQQPPQPRYPIPQQYTYPQTNSQVHDRHQPNEAVTITQSSRGGSMTSGAHETQKTARSPSQSRQSPEVKRQKHDQDINGQSISQTNLKAQTSTLDSKIMSTASTDLPPLLIGDDRPKAPGLPVKLPYDPKTLQWNADETLNNQHRYCYCGEDRNLLDVDVQCHVCCNFFHGRCIRIGMGYVVPFMTNYQFTCTNCSLDHNETWTRLSSSWTTICISALANLLLIRLRIEHPTWDKTMFAGRNERQIQEQNQGWYSRKQDIIPFLRVPRHWAALCNGKEFGDSATWTSTLANTLVSHTEVFAAHDEEARNANSFYTFHQMSLFSFKALNPRKRKADGLPGSRTDDTFVQYKAEAFSAIPPERSSARDKSHVKAEDAPSFTQKIPTIKKEPPRALTTVAKELVRERKPTPKKAAVTRKVDVVPAKLIRRPPPYKPEDFGAIPKGPGMTQVEGQFQDGPYFSMQDIPYNKRGFKYTLCEAAPEMPAIMYRQVEVAPHCAHLDWSDMSPYLYLSRDGKTATTDKGFRMGRANVGVREGQWFWEVKVLRGNGEQGGHVRLGVARREAALDGPIGFDGYSYGIRDKGGEKMHLSRPKPFMESFGTGDVIGFHLTLPKAAKTEIVRDRIPIRYRQQLYFEQFEYTTSKDMEDLLHPGSLPSKSNLPPALKGSSLKVYKNGKLMGSAFTDLFSFWPPNSQTTRDQPAKDDGALGYYPAISVYHGGAARLNFGPDFDHPPKKVLDGSIRKMCERYDEQVAEDILNDLIDEVDFAKDLEELSLGQQELEVAPIREIAEYD